MDLRGIEAAHDVVIGLLVDLHGEVVARLGTMRLQRLVGIRVLELEERQRAAVGERIEGVAIIDLAADRRRCARARTRSRPAECRARPRRISGSLPGPSPRSRNDAAARAADRASWTCLRLVDVHGRSSDRLSRARRDTSCGHCRTKRARGKPVGQRPITAARRARDRSAPAHRPAARRRARRHGRRGAPAPACARTSARMSGSSIATISSGTPRRAAASDNARASGASAPKRNNVKPRPNRSSVERPSASQACGARPPGWLDGR